MADIIDFAQRRAAARAALAGLNINPTPDDFIDAEICFLQAVRTEIQDMPTPAMEMQTLKAFMDAHAASIRHEMAARGFTLAEPKSDFTLAAEILGLSRHAIRQVAYLAACAQIEEPPPGAA